MKNYTVIFILLLLTNQLNAGLFGISSCKNLFEISEKKDAAIKVGGIVEDINKSANKSIFKSIDLINLIQEQHVKAFFSLKKIKNRKVNKLVDLLYEFQQYAHENSSSFILNDNYEIDILIDKLLRVLYLLEPKSESDLAYHEKKINFEAQGALLKLGLKEYFLFSKDQSPSIRKWYQRVYDQTIKKVSQLFSMEYLRWLAVMVKPPQIVSFSLPPELAIKVLLDGTQSLTSDELKSFNKVDNKIIYNHMARAYFLAFISSFVFSVSEASYMVYNEHNTAVAQKYEELTSISQQIHFETNQIEIQYSYQNIFKGKLAGVESQIKRKLTKSELIVFKDKFRLKFNLPPDFPLE